MSTASPLRRTLASAPRGLIVATVIVAVQALALLAMAVAETFHIVGDRLSLGLATAVFFLAYGLVLLAAARGLVTGGTWARGPAVLTQLIQLGLAWNTRGEPEYSVPLSVVALVALAGLVSAAAAGAFEDGPRSDDDAPDA